MTVNNTDIRRLRKAFAGSCLGAMFLLGFIGECNDRLIQATRFVDPCLTIFANCGAGDFELRNAQIGDFCVDPTCTVPGGCGFGDPTSGGGFQPLGTRTEICP